MGIEQNTLQSAVFTNGKIEVVEEPPQIIAHRPDLAKGDGTVPEVSAFPPEFTPQQVFIARSVAEKHGSLQNQEWILDDLGQILANYQFDLTKIKGKGRNAGQKAIAVSLEDINFAGEPIVIKARGIGVPSSAQRKAEVTCVSEEKEPLNFDFEAKGQDWELQIQDLSSGLYRITVTAENTGAAPVTPVHDLFEVSNKADYQS